MQDMDTAEDGWQLYLAGIRTPRHHLIDECSSSVDGPVLRGASVDTTLCPSPLRRLTQRSFDLVIAVVATILAAPLLIIIGVVIRATSPGPALFRQERIGHLGRAFVVLKFRTMDVDAERQLPELVAENERFRGGLLSDMKPFEDSRITRVGALLRRHSLDELPQLVNVLRGEMSIVGPRPFLPIEAVRFGQSLPAVLAVKPGLTGLWQVSGRSDLGFEGRLAFDLDYVRDNSLARDIAICLRTLPVVVRGNGFKSG